MIDRTTETYNTLSILDKDNNEVMEVYTYNFSSELMGRESIVIELSLPIQYEDGVEKPYPFSTSWHINYNNDIYFLNSENPTGVKDNQSKYIKYTLVFESLRNSLNDTFIKPYGRVYRDENNDGYADPEEVISDILLGKDVGFYGNIYDFVLWLRKSFENSYGYIQDQNGNDIEINGHYSLKYTVILNKIEYNTDDYSDQDELYQQEYADRISNSPHYNVSDVENIDTTNTTFFSVLQKMNEVFTYTETINGKEKKIGYTFSFQHKTINGYSYYVIIIDPDSDVVKNAADEDVVFEYGGLKKGGGLQSITRTTQDNRLPTRIYGNGSGENLPVNYFYIKEDRSNEIWNIDERKIQSINDLSTYFINHPDEIDYTKQYLVPDEDYPFVYDKYIYAGGRIPLATSNFTYSTSFNVVSTTVRKADSIDFANKQYIVNGVAYPMQFGYIYLVENNNIWNAFYFNASGNNDIPAETVIYLGVWSDNDLGEGFDNNTGLPIITNTFLTNGTREYLDNSDILVLVNKSDNLPVAPEVLEEDKIYYVIMPNADNTGSYLGTFFVKSSGMWYNTELQTYERVNPYTKYISNLQVLFPDFLRSYIAGWRYGYMYVKANAINNNGEIKCSGNISTDYQINKDYNSLDAITSSNLITLYIINDIYPMAYMRYKGSWELVGILETDTDNEYYNKDIFDKGLQDFCKGIRPVQQALYDYTEYDYKECGKVYRPIIYYEDKELKDKYGIIEVRKDFDIKPSIVKLYLAGQGRLDELVDVYIPCLDDESAEEDRNNPEKWGKYWEDTAFIETDVNGNKYNRKVPDLIFPQKSEEYIIIKTKNITSSPYIALAEDSITEVNIHNYNAEAVFNNPSIRNSLYIKEVGRVFGDLEWTWNGVTQYDTAPCFPFEYEFFCPIYWKMINSVDGSEIQSQTRLSIKKFKVKNIVTLLGNGYIPIPEEYYNQNFKAYITEMAFGKVAGSGDIITRIEFFAQSASIRDTHDIPKNGNINIYIRTTFNTYNRSGWKQYLYTRTINGNKQLTVVGSGYTTIYSYSVQDLEPNNIINMEYMFNTYIEDVKVQITPNFTLYGRFYNIKSNNKPPSFSTHKGAWDYAKNKITMRPPKILAFNIKCSLNVIFDETREFFIYTKDIRFNPALPAFQGEQAPDVVFSSGDLQGIDNKFALSQIPSHKTEYFTRLQTGVNIPLSTDVDEYGNLIEEIPVINTQESENDTTTIEVPATYRATLGFILPDTADNQSVFRYLPQRNIKPKAKDLFILENVLYPHNPYVYAAERKLSKSLREELDIEARYTYTIIFDDIRRETLGIDWHQLRVGNKIYIKNNSLITTENEDYAIFIIEKVSIEKREDSLYDRYTLVLKNYTKQGHTNVINSLDNGGGYRRFSDTVITTDTFNDTVVDLRNNFSGLIKPLKKLAQKNETNNTDNTLKINGLEHKTNIIKENKLSYKEADVLPKEMEEKTLYFIPDGKGGLDAYLYSNGERKKIN